MRLWKDRRARVRIVTFAAALTLTLGVLAWSNYAEKERYRWQLEASDQHYFSELAESMRGVSTALRKGQYSGSRVLMATLAGEVGREAAAAKFAMSGLPFSDVELEKTAKFLSQVGDYAYYLAKKDASGIGMTDEERENMRQLSETAYSLSTSLDELYGAVAEGSMSVSYALESEHDAEHKLSGIAAALSEIETQFPEYAGLIYDGPFSEHITSREPILLAGKTEVSETEAEAVAAASGDFGAGELELCGRTEGSLPTYAFLGERDGVTWYFDVAVTGGVLVDMYCSVQPDGHAVDADICVENAKRWLMEHGYGELAESYYYEQDGVVTINFAAVEQGVICYPDLIKVQASAETGQVIGMEARGYVMNHHARSFEPVVVSADDARAMLRSELAVESVRLAVIPTAGEYELVCHEFLCRDEAGTRALIYVNAVTGVEEQILILVENDMGTLAI